MSGPNFININGIQVWDGKPFDEPHKAELLELERVFLRIKPKAGVACAETAGTYAGFMRHRRAKESPCEPCDSAYRMYGRKKQMERSKRGEKPCPGCNKPMHYRSKQCLTCFHSGNYPGASQCGTRAAYRRHLRHKEVPCELCREAERLFQREAKVKRDQDRKAA